MAILVYECPTARERRPEWMKNICSVLRNAQRNYYAGKREELEQLQYAINAFVRQLKLSGTLGTDVTTEITSDNTLLIKRPRQTVITVRFT